MMSRHLLLAALTAVGLCAFSAEAAAPDAASDANARVINVSVHGGPASRRMTLALSKATVVQLDTDARDVLVSNPEVVDAVVRTPRRIFLLAMKTGQTNAFFFDQAGHQILSLDIRVEKDTGDLSAMIHENLPGSNVKVSGLNDNVVLTGNVESASESTRAQDLAARFAGDPAKVVNMLKIQGGEQVMLKVRIAEMDRNIAKQFGVNLAAAAVVAGVPIAAQTDNEFGLLGHALSDMSGGFAGQVCQSGSTPLAGGSCMLGPNNVQGVLKALETVGLVHILAEPNLTAVSGETARFLAGGEFPVPSGRDTQGNVSVQFKDFGVGLSFTPVVLSPGRISLQISTEVSELTNTGAFILASQSSTDPTTGITTTTPGLTVPALSVRRAQTTVELPSGGSFAIAGLMQHTTKQVLEAFPGLKDMPVLGALFRSRDFENDETELVVLISAYLVNPTIEAKLSTPVDGFEIPTDPETILFGHLNAVYKKDPATAKVAAGGSVGYIVQ
jgi:pilus assembly protein CpaC